ncbi:unnamed protein product [Caretta caretta]
MPLALAYQCPLEKTGALFLTPAAPFNFLSSQKPGNHAPHALPSGRALRGIPDIAVGSPGQDLGAEGMTKNEKCNTFSFRIPASFSARDGLALKMNHNCVKKETVPGRLLPHLLQKQ